MNAVGKSRFPSIATTVRNGVLRAYRCEKGATAIEYSLMASLIALVIIAAVANMGSVVNQMYAKVNSAVH